MDFLNDDKMPGSDNAKDFLNKNVWVLWTIRIVLVIYASFVAPNLNKNASMFFNNVIVRLIMALLIIYLCYIDPTSAILLAVSFVVSVQTLNKYKISSITNNEDSFTNDMDNENESFANPQIMVTEDEDNNNITQNSMNNAMENSMNNSTNNSMDNNVENPLNNSMENELFTNKEQLEGAQNNETGVDRNEQVQTWKEQLGPQGLNVPGGHNLYSSPMDNLASF